MRISAIASNCPPTRKLAPAIASKPAHPAPAGGQGGDQRHAAPPPIATIIAPCTCGPNSPQHLHRRRSATAQRADQRRNRHADVNSTSSNGDRDGAPRRIEHRRPVADGERFGRRRRAAPHAGDDRQQHGDTPAAASPSRRRRRRGPAGRAICAAGSAGDHAGDRIVRRADRAGVEHHPHFGRDHADAGRLIDGEFLRRQHGDNRDRRDDRPGQLAQRHAAQRAVEHGLLLHGRVHPPQATARSAPPAPPTATQPATRCSETCPPARWGER